MAGLAHILADWGVAVSGTDVAASAMTRALARRGIAVGLGHRAEAVAGADLVVYSNAVPVDNPERQEAAARGIPTCLRGEFLARLAPYFATVVCVAGSHGKTTTTAMLAHILRQAGLDPGYLVGGSVTGWRRSAAAGAGRILVTEVDESDGTQTLMHSALAVVTNIDDDHCWSVGGNEGLQRIFAQFAGQAAAVLAWDSPETRQVLARCRQVRFAGPGAVPPGLVLALPGQHNRWNACLALLAAAALGVPVASGQVALRSFRGVERRLSPRFRAAQDRRVLVEDYAHHPTELRASLAALKEVWPEHRLRVVFQPHRYERVKRYAQGFAEALSRFADEAIVVPPFAAWLDDCALADPRAIANAVQGPSCRYWEGSLEALAHELAGASSSGAQVLAVIGAGDLPRVLPEVVRAWREAEWGRLESALVREGLPVDRSLTWAELTTLGVGADRPLRVAPRDRAELGRALRLAAAEQIPVWTLGAGSTLVGTDDEPLRLTVVLTAGDFTAVDSGDGLVTAGAGLCLSPLIRSMAAEGKCAVAMAPLAWVPATLGGAVRRNAGARGVAIGQFVSDVFGLRLDGSAWQARGDEIVWNTGSSSIPADVIVTAVRLRCAEAAPEVMRRALAAAGAWRRQAQPRHPSAGCVFRNPPGDLAGRLLEEAGCKGLSRGSLRVSDRHANVIVNQPAALASEEDMRELVECCRDRVLARFGVLLEDALHWCAAAGV
jgi:UDP-N-acetylmuramate--alanine ligase